MLFRISILSYIIEIMERLKMCFGLLKNLTGSLLLLIIIKNEFLNSVISGYATSVNNSEEIKIIFSHGNNITNVIHPDLKGTYKNKNFAEGGLIESISDNKLEQNLLNNSKYDPKSGGATEKQYMTFFQKNVSKAKSYDILNSSTQKTLLGTKLPESGSNLFLGIPEVIHVNGTSSVKPRKGVDYSKIDNKIVARKGVENENKENYFFSNYSCFQLNKNNCYNAEKILGLQCKCCKDSNAQGEIFKQQALVNCSKCKPTFLVSADTLICENICCKAVFHNSNSKTATQDDFILFKNNSKLKPTITKVPYDIEIVTEYLSKAKQKIFIPVILSLLLLPLFSVFMFFIWRRTKDYWDKRFYKRMDFLIDGMYND